MITSAGVGIPTVRMATAVVEAHLSASKISAGQSIFVRNEKVGSTKNTKFNLISEKVWNEDDFKLDVMEILSYYK